MQSEQVWQAALGQLQLEMSKATFETWMRDTQLLTQEDGAFVVGVTNAYAKDWLENRLRSTVKRILTSIVGRTVELRFVVWPAQTLHENGERVAPASAPLLHEAAPAVAETFAFSLPTNLNPKYTFETFVVGPNNRLAHAACLAAAENPARAYNPVFLYGGVGLGKTHLLQAVGNACALRGLHVLYVSSEEFTNDLINAIRTHTTEAFRDKYRSIDVLLIDDIQFIAGKEATQEEFFHTFNTLHGQDKQLVITSDRPPKALAPLEERLRSRFEWGLAVDIQPPDIETRQAILRSKAERAFELADDGLRRPHRADDHDGAGNFRPGRSPPAPPLHRRAANHRDGGCVLQHDNRKTHRAGPHEGDRVGAACGDVPFAGGNGGLVALHRQGAGGTRPHHDHVRLRESGRYGRA